MADLPAIERSLRLGILGNGRNASIHSQYRRDSRPLAVDASWYFVFLPNVRSNRHDWGNYCQGKVRRIRKALIHETAHDFIIYLRVEQDNSHVMDWQIVTAFEDRTEAIVFKLGLYPPS